MSATEVHEPTEAPIARSEARERWAPWMSTVAFYGALAAVTTILSIWFVGLFTQPWGIPLVYNGDALSAASSFKTVVDHGWYEYNPEVGAPWGQHYHDFPLADNFGFIAARFLALFTHDWAVVFNTYYVVTYPLAAMSGAWFVRLVGGSRVVAFAMGLLFAFAPYHFWRGEGHLYLSGYFPVPLAAGLVFMVLAGHPLWARRDSGRWWNPWTWSTRRSIYTVLILALMGTTSSYYSVFTLFFFTFAVIALLLLRHRLRSLGGAVVAMVGLMVVMVANMAPDILYSLGQPTNIIGLTRSAVSTETFSLKLASLVLPVPWERIGPLGQDRRDYDRLFPLPSEQPMLGFIGAFGFLFLLVVAGLAVLRSRTAGSVEESEHWKTQHRLAFLTLFGFLTATVGGFSTLFALLVSDNIRSWNRISIFLMLFALASVALLFDRGVRWLVRRTPGRERVPVQRAVAGLAAVVLVAVGLFDQVKPTSSSGVARVRAQWTSDQSFAHRIEARVPAQTLIFQLPYLTFPETPGLNRMADSDGFRIYLHSRDLRFSYGGIKGRPRADWADAVGDAPISRMLVEIGAAHFGGVLVDRFGYTASADKAVEARLREVVDPTPLISPDQRFVFYDMANYNVALASKYSASDLAEIGSHALAHPVSYWQESFGATKYANGHTYQLSRRPSPTVFIDNPQAAPAAVAISFILRSSGVAAPTQVRWPDGVVQTVAATPAGVAVSRTLELSPGRSVLGLSVAPGVTPRPASFTLVDYKAQDPVLTSFSVR